MSRKNKVPRDEEKIGFIGLGNMGGALAGRLADSRTMVFDRDSRRIAPLVESGSLPARDSGEIASSCDIILACLPTSSVTEELLFGKQGILPNMRSSQIFIDMTSGDPELSRYQAARLRNHGIDFVDAPVSGGPQGAIRGEIAIMVGADESLYKKVYPTLNRISENIFLAGPVGTGHALKAGNNLLNLICRLASFEVVSLMVNEGIDPRCAVEILQKSSGRNYATEITLPDNILSGKMRQGFSMALMQKDASLAIDMARKHDQNMSLGELAVSNLREISVEYGESSDMSKLALYFEKKTRARIRP